MNKLVHFEITAGELARAQKFYEEAFGWEVKDSGMPNVEYLLVSIDKPDAPGINGAIMPKEYRDQPVINTIGVDDLDDMMKKVGAAGGKLAGEVQDIPGVGRHVYAFDTEGNLFGMLQAGDEWPPK
ncbi:MAG TPA: VOC family protein [Candidatus Saccharimonadia bacterium]|nr:VOC family protein [Candidatus Saccharimonadia bacterium]